MKYLNKFNESELENKKTNLRVGDRITFYWNKWDHKLQKNEILELIGKISEIDNDISWGCLDVKVLPDEQKFRSMSKDGYLWISSNYIK